MMDTYRSPILYGTFNSEVQYAHRVALTGIVDRQWGHPFVVGSAAGASLSRLSLFILRMRRNRAKAIIRNEMMVLTKTP